MACELRYNEQGELQAIADNGQVSLLFDNLKNLLGEDLAKDYYSLTKNQDYIDSIKGKVDSYRRNIVNKLQIPERIEPTEDMTGILDIPRIEANGKLVYTPTVDGEKIGALRLVPYKDGYRVDTITISEDYRGYGIGTDVYKMAIHDLIKDGKSLYSLKIRAPFATKIWDRLVADGIATKEGNDYKVSANPAFLDDNMEASVNEVGTYANTSSEALNTPQTIEAKNTAIAFGVTNNRELAKKLEEAFIDQGFIIFDKNKLIRAGYNEYEASKIMSDEKLQQQIKTSLPKVKNTEFELEYDADFVSPKDSSIGLFGKLNTENPYIQEKNSKPQQNVKAIIDGEIVDKTSDTEAVLRKSYPIVAKPISADLNTLFTAVKVSREDVLISKNNSLKKVVEEIKQEVIDYGVDLKDISNRIYPIQKLKDFVTSLERYIVNPNSQFAEVYDDFFEQTVPLTRPNQGESLSEILLETELDEYELFRDFGLIRKSGDLYTKVAKIDNLFDVYQTQPNAEQTIEEVQAKVPLMQVTNEDADADVLADMYMYKSYLNVPLETKSNEQTDNIDIREVVNNPFKKATYRGVELVNNDPITKSNAELYEREKPETLTEETFDDSKAKRVEALTNPASFPLINSDYVLREDGLIQTKNNTEIFVRVGDSVYELVYNYENLNFYKEVESEEKNYSNADYGRYLPLATTEEQWVNNRELSKKENERITQENFDCQG